MLSEVAGHIIGGRGDEAVIPKFSKTHEEMHQMKLAAQVKAWVAIPLGPGPPSIIALRPGGGNAKMEEEWNSKIVAEAQKLSTYKGFAADGISKERAQLRDAVLSSWASIGQDSDVNWCQAKVVVTV